MPNLSEKVNVRLATLADENILLLWRNDKITRQMSINTNLIEIENHHKWFINSIRCKNRVLMICSFKETNERIGVVWFDVCGSNAQVSINLAPEMRRLGLSKVCLTNSIDFLLSQNSEIRIFQAKIKKINQKSIRSFVSVGFEMVGDDANMAYFEYQV